MKKAFTLLELIVVIIIIGILAVLGLTQYTKVTEKGRSAEAKAILGELRTSELAYYLDKGAYASSFSSLGLTLPGSCTSTHYFWYAYYVGTLCGGQPYVYAARCTSGGKSPDASSQYLLRLCIGDGDRSYSDAGYW